MSLIAVEEHFMTPALAREANDELAQAIRDHPGRFAGLACVAPQDPVAAVVELERAVSELGLVGVVINSHVRGEYLDAPRFSAVFEAAEALGAPIYLHPSLLPAGAVDPYLDYGLMAAMWGYAADHPFEDMSAETAAFAKASLTDAERAAVSTANARTVFGLPAPPERRSQRGGVIVSAALAFVPSSRDVPGFK